MFKHLSALSHHAAWRKQLEMLLDSTGDGIYGIDLNGRCIFINKAGAEMLGYSVDEVLGRNMHYLMHHSYANHDLMPVCDCHIFRAFQENKGCRIDNEVLWRRDGSCFPAEYASYPIFHEQQVVGAVVTFNDITERVQVQNIRHAAQAELERRVAERTDELQKAHDRMRRLSSHLTTVREAERTRIARELHDDLGSKLTAFDLELKVLSFRCASDEKLTVRIDSMLQLAEGAMDSLRRVLTDLRPGVLDHLGLWAAVEHLLGEFSQRRDIQVHFFLAPALEPVRLGRATETAMYRILQEALNNVGKHSGASQVTVEIDTEQQGIVFRIQDNGQGMPARNLTTGFGLMGIEERAWDIGARCLIESLPGQGVSIILKLPQVLAT